MEGKCTMMLFFMCSQTSANPIEIIKPCTEKGGEHCQIIFPVITSQLHGFQHRTVKWIPSYNLMNHVQGCKTSFLNTCTKKIFAMLSNECGNKLQYKNEAQVLCS